MEKLGTLKPANLVDLGGAAARELPEPVADVWRDAAAQVEVGGVARGVPEGQLATLRRRVRVLRGRKTDLLYHGMGGTPFFLVPNAYIAFDARVRRSTELRDPSRCHCEKGFSFSLNPRNSMEGNLKLRETMFYECRSTLFAGPGLSPRRRC